MKETLQSNQEVTLSGCIVSKPEFNHEVFGEKFYQLEVRSDRLSGQSDTLLLIISDRLFADVTEIVEGYYIKVRGEIRSFNHHDETGKAHLSLSVFVKELLDDELGEHDVNDVWMRGFICREPGYRTTPMGREISDILIAVNRKYGKSDYIPAICWGRNAKYASNLDVGDEVTVKGRFQSRTYKKRINEDEVEERTAYELSISSINIVE